MGEEVNEAKFADGKVIDTWPAQLQRQATLEGLNLLTFKTELMTVVRLARRIAWEYEYQTDLTPLVAAIRHLDEEVDDYVN